MSSDVELDVLFDNTWDWKRARETRRTLMAQKLGVTQTSLPVEFSNDVTQATP